MTSKTNQESTLETCPVTDHLEALRAQLESHTKESRSSRSEIARVVRIITEISLGRGSEAYLDELESRATHLMLADSIVVENLLASLKESRPEWLKHVNQNECVTGTCFRSRSAPCQVACPAHIDIPSMIAHIGLGQYTESLSVLLKDSPLPSSCGLVCPAPCEDACVQKTISEPVLIKPMKSVASRCSPSYPKQEQDEPTGKKIAIVGAGPAGLTAAYYLAQKGHQVEIFDEREHAGGIMRYGIPNYRLPAEVLNHEIDQIKALGVKIHTSRPVKKVTEFRENGFDATFLATGLQNSRRLGVPGDDLPFVLGGMDFLSQVREGKNPQIGPHIIVIGGGNAAIDVAMTAFRQGATKVQMWYRRRRRDMPANPHEVTMALAEGVELVELWAPTQILPGNLIEFSRSKNAPDAATAQPVQVHADHILAGIGQDADLSYLDGSAIKTEWGNIIVNRETLETDEPGIFAGGDIGHGASTVVAAIGSGKRAAESIHSWLMKMPMNKAVLRPQRRDEVQFIPADKAARISYQRPHVVEKDPTERKFSHEAIQYDWSEEEAKKEAERCLRCDLCIGCGLCELVCTEMGVEALKMTKTRTGRFVFDDFMRPAELCIGCGACAAVCPTGAIRVENRDGYRVTEITGTVVQRQPLEECTSCGIAFSATSHYNNMRKEAGSLVASHSICPACARMQSAESLHNMYFSGART